MNHQKRQYSSENYAKLNRVEREIFNMMAPQNGVVYIKGKPGIGKTKTVQSIAAKLDMQFFEFALTQIDAADLGGLPVIKHVDVRLENGKVISQPQMTYAVNDWALQSNEKPTIIFFDEANRPAEDVMNALLKLFEGHIGLNFKFNKNVYMVAAGNLGMKEDGTTVNALDSAMNNRLIHLDFDIPFRDWVKNFADKHVEGVIISFIESNQDHYHMMVKQQQIYASPRSWTMFSDYLRFWGITDLKHIAEISHKYAANYIGAKSAAQFKMYVDSLRRTPMPNILEIRSQGKALKSTFEKLELTQFSYIINSCNIDDLKQGTESELGTFIEYLTDDQVSSLYSRIIGNVANHKLDHDGSITKEEANNLIKPWKDVLRIRKDIAESLIEA